jgi:hypothetical protein
VSWRGGPGVGRSGSRVTSRPAPPNTALVGIAGVHYVVSELSRRGLVALPTVRNTAAYDVVVVTPDGRRHANIQVKTSSKRALFFRMPPSARVKAGPRDFYVLARWIEKERRYECFMLTGREAKAAVRGRERWQRSRRRAGHRKSIVPNLSVSKDPERAALWRRRWQTWRL